VSPAPLRVGFLHLLSGSLLGRALGFGANLLLSRALGPGQLGVFSLILSTTQTVEMTVRGGVDYGITCALTGPGAALPAARQGEIAHIALRVVQGATLGVMLLLWLWVMPGGGLFPRNLPMDRQTLLVALVTVSSLECLSGLQWDLLLIQGRTAALALRQGVFAPGKLLAAWLGALGGGLGGALAGYALVVAVQGGWLRQRCRALWPWPRQGHFEGATALDLVRQGLPLYTTNLLASLVFLPLLAWVARGQGLAEVGYIRVGQILVQLFTLLPGALVPVLFVRLRGSGGPEEQTRGIERSLRLLWWSGLVCLVLYLLLDRWVVPLFFGNAFLPSLQATRVLVLAAVVESLSQVLHQPLLASRRTGLYMATQNGAALLAAWAGIQWIPSLGVAGFLAAKLVFALVPLLTYFILAQPEFRSAAPLWRHLLLTLALVPVCWLPSGPPSGVARGEVPALLAALGLLALESWPLLRWWRGA
jgi:O-antigen/teichoic acid export membrane protein